MSDQEVENLKDIVSQYMADLEMKYRRAIDEHKFYSVCLLNRCREIFHLPPLSPMNPKDFTEAIQ